MSAGSPTKSSPSKQQACSALWIPKGLVGLVLVSNLYCAALFLLNPASYAPGFELEGAIGSAYVRSLGLLFLMWNVPYLMAAWHPLKHWLSLVESFIMQGMGLAGETLLLTTIPDSHLAIHSSIYRFILFDGAGFILLLAALVITKRKRAV